MKIRAKKVENGFLIPMDGEFKKIKDDKILLEVEILTKPQIDTEYSALDQLVGLCESGKKKSSTNHDKIVYKTK